MFESFVEIERTKIISPIWTIIQSGTYRLAKNMYLKPILLPLRIVKVVGGLPLTLSDDLQSGSNVKFDRFQGLKLLLLNLSKIYTIKCSNFVISLYWSIFI